MHYQSNISFICPICQADIIKTIEVPGTYWGGDTADERYVSDTETVECDNCSTFFDLEVGNQDGTIFVSVDGHAPVEVRASHAEFIGQVDGDDEFDIPSDAEIHILETLKQVRTLLDQHGSETASNVVNRMVFSQQVAALEAYLADTLLWAVKTHEPVLVRIVRNDTDLKDQKLSLSEALSDPQIVLKNAVRHLQGQLYHNLAKVEMLYRIAAGVDIFPSTDVKVRLFMAMPIRHDCVHRNGYDKDGNIRMEITAPYVRQFEADVRALVIHIEEAMIEAIK